MPIRMNAIPMISNQAQHGRISRNIAAPMLMTIPPEIFTYLPLHLFTLIPSSLTIFNLYYAEAISYAIFH